MSNTYERQDLEARARAVAGSMTVRQMKEELGEDAPPPGFKGKFRKHDWAVRVAARRFHNEGKEIGLSFFKKLI